LSGGWSQFDLSDRSPEFFIAWLEQASAGFGTKFLGKFCRDRNGAVLSAFRVDEADQVVFNMFGVEFFRFSPACAGR